MTWREVGDEEVVMAGGHGEEDCFTDCVLLFCFFLLLFWAPLCLAVGAKKYFFGALYKNSDGSGIR